jgi:hypothetical protein
MTEMSIISNSSALLDQTIHDDALAAFTQAAANALVVLCSEMTSDRFGEHPRRQPP